jgi:hypothetical protein
MTLEEFELKVKEWYLENKVNLSETWFEVKTIGRWKSKRVCLENKIPCISHRGLFRALETHSEKTYSECFEVILKALAYWDTNKTYSENIKCVEHFCTIKRIRR